MKINEIERRIERLHEHVKEHPADYVAVVAELQMKSMLIDKIRKEEVNERLKEVAQIRKRRKDAEQRQRDRDGGGHAPFDSTARSSGDALSDTL